jgi:SAM-dependent methyltransferase
VSAAERLGNDRSSELWGEHRARYRFAVERLPPGRRVSVLDVASGSGFGLQMLLQAGARPVGLDYDVESLQAVRGLEPGAVLIHGDATRLPLALGSLDMVVSFETLEHVPDAAAMVAEVRRILKPGGQLVLSTPNKAFGPLELHLGNPYHIQEFTATELRSLLLQHFSDVQLYGQTPSAAYHYVPFRMVQRHLEPAALTWKATARLPYRLKNGIALRVSGRPFYPTETDYLFTADEWADSHALIAVAR